jgi:hypothetical protein
MRCDYTFPVDHPALPGRTVSIYSRVTHPQHGDVLHAEADGKHIIIRAATNPAARDLWERTQAQQRQAMRQAQARTPVQRMHDALNEGGEGYGSPLNDDHDRTPYHKGDHDA